MTTKILTKRNYQGLTVGYRFFLLTTIGRDDSSVLDMENGSFFITIKNEPDVN